MNDPRVISLDIETYGACERNWRSDELPLQTMFHPRRCVLTDGCPLHDLIQTVSITLPTEDPRPCHSDPNAPAQANPRTSVFSTSPSNSPSTSPAPTPPILHQNGDGTHSSALSKANPSRSWNAERLASLKPGPTMVFLMHRADHRWALAKWLLHADTLIGQNLPFDITFLRAFSPLFRTALDGRRHTIIDVSYLNFAHVENRPERSLKDIGPVLGQYIYAEGSGLRDGFRYPSPLDPALHSYNAQDTFNSILAASCLASLIQRDYPGVPKLSPEAISYWSAAYWLAIEMIESGTPFHRDSLEAARLACEQEVAASEALCLSHNLILSGKGSPASKQALMNAAFAACDSLEDERSVESVLGVPSIYQCETVELTKVKKEVSTTEVNRKLAAALLPADHPLQPVLAAWKRHATAQGNLSKYLLPLLDRKRSKQSKNPLSSILLPQPGAKPCPLQLLPPAPSAAECTEPPNPATPASLPLPQEAAPPIQSATPLRSSAASTPTPNNGTTCNSASTTCSSVSVSSTASTSIDPGVHPCRSSPKIQTKPTASYIASCSSSSARCPSPSSASSPRALSPCGSTSSLCEPQFDPTVQLTYSKWFVLPSNFKDSGGGRGGQQQARPASVDPNIQQFPPLLKDCIRSRFEGGLICAPDLSQVELRTAALLSGDASLVRNYAEGRDLHTDRAVFVFGESVKQRPGFKSGDMENDPRQWAKRLNFEDLYLAGPLKMQQVMLKDSSRLFPLSFFEEVRNSRRTLRPGLCAWQDEMVALAARQGYLSLPITGHSRQFAGGYDEAPEIANFPVQATAAITQYEILRYVRARLPHLSVPSRPVHFCINWYDAAYFDCAAHFLPTLRALYEEAVAHVATRGYWARLQDLYRRVVPLKAEWKATAAPSSPVLAA